MRQVADFVYNVFKYRLVKYLGLSDIFFQYQVSKFKNINMEDVAGLGLLLQKLECNTLSPNARKVSDYGVPFKLIDWIVKRRMIKANLMLTNGISIKR